MNLYFKQLVQFHNFPEQGFIPLEGENNWIVDLYPGIELPELTN